MKFRYQVKNIYKVIDNMSLNDRKEFPCDVKVVEWKEFIKNAIINTAVHLFQEDHPDVVHGFDQIMNKQGKDDRFSFVGGERSTSSFEFSTGKIAKFYEFTSSNTINYKGKFARWKQDIGCFS